MILRAWPTLPADIKQIIVKLVIEIPATSERAEQQARQREALEQARRLAHDVEHAVDAMVAQESASGAVKAGDL